MHISVHQTYVSNQGKFEESMDDRLDSGSE